MKEKGYLLAFLAAALITVGLRVYQILCLTDYETGFILPERYSAAVIVTVFIALVILLSAFLLYASTKGGKKSGTFHIMPSLFSFVLGVVMASQPLVSFTGVPVLLKILCVAFAVLSALYFIAFSVRAVAHFSFSPYFAVIPAAFFVFKSACVAIRNAYHTVISDTVFEIIAYCFIMLFFLEFARAANGISSKRSVRKFVAAGSVASLLSIAFSVPRLVIPLFSSSAVHGVSVNDFMILFTGIYIACEILTRPLFVQNGDEKVSLYYVGKH